MKRNFIFGLLLFVLCVSCENETNINNFGYVAQIVDYDTNCSAYLLNFPEDSLKIKNLIGESNKNYYRAVNLGKYDLMVGQFLRVKIRKAEKNELLKCAEIYPKSNFQSIYVSDLSSENIFSYIDTIDLYYGESYYNSEKQYSIRFDSLLNDSRCPEGMACCWAGEAVVRFEFTDNSRKHFIDLNSHRPLNVNVNKYFFSLYNLSPYPKYGEPIITEDYKARIVIKKL